MNAVIEEVKKRVKAFGERESILQQPVKHDLATLLLDSFWSMLQLAGHQSVRFMNASTRSILQAIGGIKRRPKVKKKPITALPLSISEGGHAFEKLVRIKLALTPQRYHGSKSPKFSSDSLQFSPLKRLEPSMCQSHTAIQIFNSRRCQEANHTPAAPTTPAPKACDHASFNRPLNLHAAHASTVGIKSAINVAIPAFFCSPLYINMPMMRPRESSRAPMGGRKASATLSLELAGIPKFLERRMGLKIVVSPVVARKVATR